jgi:type I restriction enzyme, R subunit
VKVHERAFEDAIEAYLLEQGGYERGHAGSLAATLGLDPTQVMEFLAATQEGSLGQLVSRYGGDAEVARTGLLKRLAHEIDERGTLDVLRHGITDQGVALRFAYFKPAHGLTPELVSLYEANRLTLVRQLHYGQGTNTLDLCLFVNGIPVATAELKNPLTHQTVEHAKAQYRSDRDPANVLLGRRALVHFAVDPEEVAMTTKLERQRTEFLPFNLGYDGGAGNPPNPNGYRTSYLWDRVWQRDAWLDLLARFMHVEIPSEGSKAERRKQMKVIFPRFHQWDAVIKLEADARKHGAGQQYLVQHSAGSGKSNTIAWTAHRLSSLHGADDEPVFNKVVVITDRLVLDRQLQDTIYQFEHVRGVVEKIDEDSAQLARALAGERARIIITTLQKFPYVLDKIGELPARRYAVIVDEAHSSQTGEAAKDLKAVLGAGAEQEGLLAAAEAEDAAEQEVRGDAEDFLTRSAMARARQPNLSFFAFTATPKGKTLELFGTKDADGRYVPFHLYTMQQAIQEGFILDVLANYTTYDLYFRIQKATRDDPEYETAKARAAIARFVTLHPHNLAQKAEVIVEHFREHTAAKISGNAKAMVVTSSRLHAVRYKEALDRYIRDKHYDDVHTLVAFSGKVLDDGFEYTEPGMNRFPESQTAKQFAEGDYQVLIVAEKFQTGYDEPLLHTMFVDKPLSGLHAVQTLSRLNRIHPPDKTDTFVLDFRNTVEEIQKAFEPYYGAAVAIPTNPNLLYDARADLDSFDVLRLEEVEQAARLIVSLGGERDHPKLYALLDPAVERFRALSPTIQDEFRAALRRFVNFYAFISQIVSFADTGLERDYLYNRALAAVLPGQQSARLDLGSEVALSHLRLEQSFQGSASLDHGSAEIRTIYDGRGGQYTPQREHLSRIVEVINERFGLNLGDADQLLFDQFEQGWVDDATLAAQARQNDLANFRLAFDRTFMSTIVTRMDANDEIFKRVLDDADFRDLLADYYVRKVYEQLRAGGASAEAL